MRRLLIVIAALMSATTARAQSLPPVPHQVLAFYYGWYTTQYGQNWVTGARWTPTAGAYTSTDTATITRQVSQAKAAGITGFIVSWWGINAFTDRQLQALLRIATQQGLTVSALVEDIGSDAAPGDANMAFTEFDYLLSTYGSQSAWLKVGGRPVLFMYDRALKRLNTTADWQGVLDRVRAKYPGALILGPGQSNPAYYPMGGANFDGLFNYALAVMVHDQSISEIEARMRKTDLALVAGTPANQIATITVGAGYDDSHTARTGPRPILQRFDGATYRASWRAAVAANPDWVLINTFNEWVEGTQIEPSVEFGTRSLDDTLGFSNAFMAEPTRPQASATQ